MPGQPEVELAFVRTRATAEREARVRPQTPKPPFPYGTEEVTFKNPVAAAVTLAGTLTRPEGAGPFPAAVLITGSGPQDRDQTLLGHKSFAVIADHLTRHGVAVLRYDDRGVGKSTGDFTAATSADFATDANAAVRFLLTRPEIRRDAIGFIGHSEGGWWRRSRPWGTPISISSSCSPRPGTNMMQLAQSQERLLGLSQGVSEADLARMQPVMADVFAAVANSASAEDARARVRAVLTPEALATMKASESRREQVVQHMANDWARYLLQVQAGGISCPDSRADSRAERHARSPGSGRREPRGHQDRARAQRGRHHPQDSTASTTCSRRPAPGPSASTQISRRRSPPSC